MELRRSTGITLLLLSALMFSTAGLFTKGVEAGPWEVIFWRGLFGSLFTIGYIASQRRLRAEFVHMGKWGLVAGLVGASGSAAFIPAFKFSTVANVALIYSAAPLIAALIAWLWFSEKVSRAALIGCLAAIIGVGIIMGGSFSGINLRGDLLAFWMTVVMASVIVIYRRHPDTPAAGPATLSSLVLLPIALTLGDPFSIPDQEILITAGFGLVFAIASVALAEGSKHLPAGEAGLLSSSEAPLAIILAFLVLSEVPAVTSLLGGALIIAGVIGSQINLPKENAYGKSS